MGSSRDRRYPSARGYGADLAFRRWGKLKANGNTRMEPVATLLRRERLLHAASPLMRMIGRTARRLGRPNLWADPTRTLDKHARRLHRRQGKPPGEQGPPAPPEAFLIEVENPGEAAVALELEMRVALDLIDASAASAATAPPPFRVTVHLLPGYSRHVIPHQRSRR